MKVTYGLLAERKEVAYDALGRLKEIGAMLFRPLRNRLLLDMLPRTSARCPDQSRPVARR